MVVGLALLDGCVAVAWDAVLGLSAAAPLASMLSGLKSMCHPSEQTTCIGGSWCQSYRG